MLKSPHSPAPNHPQRQTTARLMASGGRAGRSRSATDPRMRSRAGSVRPALRGRPRSAAARPGGGGPGPGIDREGGGSRGTVFNGNPPPTSAQPHPPVSAGSLSIRDGSAGSGKDGIRPWLGECRCIPPKASAGSVAAMEDVPGVHAREHDGGTGTYRRSRSTGGSGPGTPASG